MKTPHRMVSVLFAALGLFIATPAVVSAQEWSAAQKEVWKNVENYWALDAAGDTAGFLAYFHPDYCGWSLRSALPADKETVTKFITHDHKTTKTLVYHIQPVAIKIHGDIAFVHYYWMQITQTNGDPKEKDSSGRWTDILMKQGDKWVMIGDNGGTTKKD